MFAPIKNLKTLLSKDPGARIAEDLVRSKNNYDLRNHETNQVVVSQFARD